MRGRRGTGGGEWVPWGDTRDGVSPGPLLVGTCPTAAWGSTLALGTLCPGVQWGRGGPRSSRAGGRPCPSPLSFLYPGFLSLRSENVLILALGVIILGVCHYTLTVKGSHLATHGALTESKRWSRIWELFFVEVSLGGTGVAAGTCGQPPGSAGACGCVQPCVPTRLGHYNPPSTWVRACGMHYSYACPCVCARPQALERPLTLARTCESRTGNAHVPTCGRGPSPGTPVSPGGTRLPLCGTRPSGDSTSFSYQGTCPGYNLWGLLVSQAGVKCDP